jgi:hypothetical protein
MYTTGNAPAIKDLSGNKDIEKEFFSYSIIPSMLVVKSGESFALTCKVDSSEGLEELRWIMKANSEGPQLLNCHGMNNEGLRCDIREYPNTLFSVLNITLYETSSDYTFYCNRKSSLQSDGLQVSPHRGVAVVKVHSGNHSLEIGLEATGVSFVVVVVLVVAVFLLRKQRVRSRIMGILGV